VAEWQAPSAGLFLWVRLLEVGDIDQEELLVLMQQHQVAVMPGYCCAVDRERPCPFIRISYVGPEEIYDKGMRRLRSVLDGLADAAESRMEEGLPRTSSVSSA